jgi:putative endonuclease
MKKLLGKWGEDVISFWLEKQGYKILHRRWHCRYAEIDLITQHLESSTLCFVEVKTRSLNNWDENGILAINFPKQQKIRLAGENFLGRYPVFSTGNCRFDVALLTYQKIYSPVFNPEIATFSPDEKNIINYQGYEFTIVDYLKNAFGAN